MGRFQSRLSEVFRTVMMKTGTHTLEDPHRRGQKIVDTFPPNLGDTNEEDGDESGEERTSPCRHDLLSAWVCVFGVYQRAIRVEYWKDVSQCWV